MEQGIILCVLAALTSEGLEGCVLFYKLNIPQQRKWRNT